MKKYLAVWGLLGWIANLNAQETIPVKRKDKEAFIRCVLLLQCWDEGVVPKGSFFMHARIAPALQKLLTSDQYRELVNNINIRNRIGGDNGQIIMTIGFCTPQDPDVDYLISGNYPEGCATVIVISFYWKPFPENSDPNLGIDGLHKAVLGSDGQGGKLQLLFLPQGHGTSNFKPARYWQEGMKMPLAFDDLPTVSEEVKRRCQNIGLFNSAKTCLRGLEASFTHPFTVQ